MNKEQLLELINSKIAGQGSAVDIGGALAPVLAELVINSANVPTTYIAQIENLGEVEIPEDILESIQMGDNLMLKYNTEQPTINEWGIPTIVEVGKVGVSKNVLVQWFLPDVENGIISFFALSAIKQPETGWSQTIKTADMRIS